MLYVCLATRAQTGLQYSTIREGGGARSVIYNAVISNVQLDDYPCFCTVLTHPDVKKIMHPKNTYATYRWLAIFISLLSARTARAPRVLCVLRDRQYVVSDRTGRTRDRRRRASDHSS